MRWSLEINLTFIFQNKLFPVNNTHCIFFTGRIIKRDIMIQFHTEVEAQNVFVVKNFRTNDYSKN